MPAVDAQKIYKDLENKKFAPIYFFYGDEPYLLGQIPDRFKFSVLDENTFDFNLNIFYAGDADVSAIKDTVETLPVMTMNRLVILKNAQELKESEWLELESLFKKPVESTVFVICADKVDKRKKSIKLIFESAITSEFKKPYENQIPQWVHFLAQNYELKFSNEATHRLHRLVGNNLSELDHQIQKLKNFVGSKPLIDLKDVNEIVSNSREESVFDFSILAPQLFCAFT